MTAIFVNVHNLKKAKAWYTRALGLLPNEKNQMMTQDVTLVLYESPHPIPAAQPIATLKTTDLHFAYDAIQKSGATMIDDPPSLFQDSFRFADLDGNVLIMQMTTT